MTDGLTLAIGDRTAVVEIHRPARRNALDLNALEQLDAALLEAEGTQVSAVILTGSDGHFCAGADLTQLEDLTFTNRLREVLDRLADFPATTITAIEGSCMGLGMQLALASDIRIADAGARFAVPVAKLGLMVDHWTLSRLVDAMGFGAARHLVLTAEILRGDDGFRLGFVQELVEAQGAAVAAAHHLADRVATLAPLSIRGSKLGLNRLERDHDDSDYRAAFRTAWESEDLAEGQRAFAEQRSPVFKGQ